MTIEWKKYPIETDHDGVRIKGTIVYWSKDYRVVLEHPVANEGRNLHMMYMIPARFVTPNDKTPMKNVKDVDIVDVSIEKLKKLYEEVAYEKKI
tara:strand:+ start:357 stop:638 length:282 start_codon:yes stop_codon:yes gene_type:complete